MARASNASAATSTRSRKSGARSVRLQPDDRRRGLTFDDVASVGLTLPDTEEGTAYGGRCLKVNGRHFTGVAINKSAEPNSLIIHIAASDRDVMIDEQPDIYYTAEHYQNYDCVLVRLSRIDRSLLGDLLRTSHRFVTEKYKGKKRPATRKPRR